MKIKYIFKSVLKNQLGYTVYLYLTLINWLHYRFGKRDYKDAHDKPGFYMNRETTTPPSLNYPAYPTPTPPLPRIFGKLFPKLRYDWKPY